MRRTHRLFATVVGVTLPLVGCGVDTASPSTPPTSKPPTTSSPATTGVPADDLGGFGPPAPAAGEFDLTTTWPIAGTAELDERGCWWLAGDGDRGVLLAPTGTELGDAGDSLVTADGSVITDGASLDIAGAVLYSADDLPGGVDGRWGNYLAFCGADAPIVVATSLSIPGSIDVGDATSELVAVGARLFDTDHGCGYGFAAGSADERWAVHLYVRDAAPIEPGVITLPDDRFDAVVIIGRHLYANHCDDVVEWFEPTRTVVATWPITDGSFEWPGSDGTGSCDQGSVTTTLDGAVVDVGSTLVELAPITIINRSFGCFAG